MSVKCQVSCGQQSHTLVEKRILRRKRNKGEKASRAGDRVWVQWQDSLGNNGSQTSWGIFFFLRMASENLLKGRTAKLWTVAANSWHQGVEAACPWVSPSPCMSDLCHIPFRSINFLDLRFSYLRGLYPTLWVTRLQDSFLIGIINTLILLFSFSSAAICGTSQ